MFCCPTGASPRSGRRSCQCVEEEIIEKTKKTNLHSDTPIAINTQYFYCLIRNTATLSFGGAVVCRDPRAVRPSVRVRPTLKGEEEEKVHNRLSKDRRKIVVARDRRVSPVYFCTVHLRPDGHPHPPPWSNPQVHQAKRPPPRPLLFPVSDWAESHVLDSIVKLSPRRAQKLPRRAVNRPATTPCQPFSSFRPGSWRQCQPSIVSVRLSYAGAACYSGRFDPGRPYKLCSRLQSHHWGSSWRKRSDTLKLVRHCLFLLYGQFLFIHRGRIVGSRWPKLL